MYEHPYFTQTIFAIENEQLVRATEQRRVMRERAGIPERQRGSLRRTRTARSAASVARDIAPCANCPATA